MPAKPEQIATRTTADGIAVQLWSDGVVSATRMAVPVKGAGSARRPDVIAANLRAGWLVMGEVALYNRNELITLVRIARDMARESADRIDLEEFRRRVHAALVARINTMTGANDGNP